MMGIEVGFQAGIVFQMVGNIVPGVIDRGAPERAAMAWLELPFEQVEEQDG